MEPGAAAAAYLVETTAEGAVGAGAAIAKPTMPLRAIWKRIPTDVHLPRSSHSLSIIKGRGYVFGGEIEPRNPVDNHVHVFTIPVSENDIVDHQVVLPVSIDHSDVPSGRVGHTAATIDARIYIFGGRGGKSMQPLEERGRVWVFDTKRSRWTHLDPKNGSPFPPARSYHSSTSTLHPISDGNDLTADLVGGVASGFDDHGTIFVHGGCLASGRTAEVWGFDVASRIWSRYPDAPGSPRGGASLAFSQDRLYRFGGFDGERELGGSIDFLYFSVSSFDDKGGKGELAVTPRTGIWGSVPFAGAAGPGNRSVAGLQAITTGQGRNYLLLFLGERQPSSSGHETAGRFWEDVWSFQIKPDGMTVSPL